MKAAGSRQKAVGDARNGAAATRGLGDRQAAFLRIAGSLYRRVFFVFCLLLTAHCTLPSALGQPGTPSLTSPLYGARPYSRTVSSGLPKALRESALIRS